MKWLGCAGLGLGGLFLMSTMCMSVGESAFGWLLPLIGFGCLIGCLVIVLRAILTALGVPKN